jgi:hypothetical protein
MALEELKKQLHSYVEMIEDETQLQMFNEAAESYINKQSDALDLLPPEQLKRLEESIRQVDEGMLTSHDQVMKLSKQWLTK